MILLLTEAEETEIPAFNQVLLSTENLESVSEHAPLKDCPAEGVVTQFKASECHSLNEVIVRPIKPMLAPLGPRSRGVNKWVREDWGLRNAPVSTASGPAWPHATHRRVMCGEGNKILFHEAIDATRAKKHYDHLIPKEVCHVVTEFCHDMDGFVSEALLNSHHTRCVSCRVKCVKPATALTRTKPTARIGSWLLKCFLHPGSKQNVKELVSKHEALT